MMRTMRRLVLPGFRALRFGEVAEWSNAPDSKSGLRYCRNVGSNPTLSARNANAPRGAFCVSGEGGGVDELTGFDEFAGSEFGRRRRRRAKRGVRRRDAPNNPTLSARMQTPPSRGVLRFWGGINH